MKKIRKGSLVPKYLGVTSKPNKCRHLVKFGCDVIVHDGVIYALESEKTQYFFVIKKGWIGGKNGKPRRYGRLAIDGIRGWMVPKRKAPEGLEAFIEARNVINSSKPVECR